ncbi:MAG: hypothetical protein DBY20_06890 [Coriobacteriia bacterium]|nr:MAG: hypothetical protein DBY20_06890 [Coriobacteriia bacterium]
MTLSRRSWLSLAFLAAVLALYIYGVISAGQIPAEVVAVALPPDFMVGIPLAFYLIFLRPKKMTPLAVLPVIWLGYGLSALALGSPTAGILPVLLAALFPVEAAIAVREIIRLARLFKGAKRQSADPLEWFYAVTHYLVRKELPARMMAAELGVWYYALISWRKKPSVEADDKAYSYHNASGYMSVMLGFGLAFPVEIVAVHMLLSQWNATVAIVATLLSLYAAVWLVGDARARALRPVVLGKDELRIECGIQMKGTISLSNIASVSCHEPADIDKADKLNYGTFYQANVWIVMREPVEVRTLLGMKRPLAIGLSLDDPKEFIREFFQATNGFCQGES